MCLTTYDKRKIAKEDITVYKMLCKRTRLKTNKTEYLPPYWSNYTYNKGKNTVVDEKEKIIMADFAYYVEGGFLHAFTNLNYALYTCRQNFMDTTYYVAYADESFKDEYRVYEMTIPKGTEYYIGSNSDICAKTLVWKNMTPCEKPV